MTGVVGRGQVADWLAVSEDPLPVAEVLAWAGLPDCGAIVMFCGTVRDRTADRTGVTSLEYEAYLEQVEPCLAKIAVAARDRWPQIGRLAMLHRVGRLEVGEVAVVVAVSTPHRGEAFESGRYCIDTLKHTVPIWKRETWAGGSEWVSCTAGEAIDDPRS